jgi:hypothetical protein
VKGKTQIAERRHILEFASVAVSGFAFSSRALRVFAFSPSSVVGLGARRRDDQHTRARSYDKIVSKF